MMESVGKTVSRCNKVGLLRLTLFKVTTAWQIRTFPKSGIKHGFPSHIILVDNHLVSRKLIFEALLVNSPNEWFAELESIHPKVYFEQMVHQDHHPPSFCILFL